MERRGEEARFRKCAVLDKLAELTRPSANVW